MGFNNLILVVYASEDNDNAPADINSEGWVSRFIISLEMMLSQIWGEKPSIGTLNNKSTAVSEVLEECSILIPILSPSFVASRVCINTISTFSRILRNKGMYRENRIFKVSKLPIRAEKEPELLTNMLGYNLYHAGDGSDEITEFNDILGVEFEKNYWMKIVDLAYDIDESLPNHHADSHTPVKPLFSDKSVYLAETGPDLIIERNIIRRELQRKGYQVLPNATLPNNLNDLKDTVKNELKGCDLSIHLIGSSYGSVPRGADKSVVELQNKIAAEISSNTQEEKEKHLSRLIWISPELKNVGDQQKLFIDNLKRDLSILEGAEVLQTPLEDFKSIIEEELVGDSLSKESIIPGTPPEDVNLPSVYMIYDKRDSKEASKLITGIKKQGFKVLIPTFYGELFKLRQEHISHLINSDIAIIYQGKLKWTWVEMKILDLLKAPGFGRNKPILGKALITQNKASLNADKIKHYNIELIEEVSEKSINESIERFLKQAKR